MSQELQGELQQARKALHLTRLQLACYGMSAPVHLTMEAENLEEKVARLEAALGQGATEPRQLPPVPARRVVEEPAPAPVFEERARARQVGDRYRDIEHQLNLLSIHRRNLALLRSQAKMLGAHAPFHIHSQILDAQASIAGIKDVLRSFYNYAVENLPGDV